MIQPAVKTSDRVQGALWLLASPWLTGWAFMLAVGAIHGSWWSEVPTIGYLWAVLIPMLLRLTFSRWAPTAASLAAARQRRELREAERERLRQEAALGSMSRHGGSRWSI